MVRQQLTLTLVGALAAGSHIKVKSFKRMGFSLTFSALLVIFHKVNLSCFKIVCVNEISSDCTFCLLNSFIGPVKKS